MGAVLEGEQWMLELPAQNMHQFFRLTLTQVLNLFLFISKFDKVAARRFGI